MGHFLKSTTNLGSKLKARLTRRAIFSLATLAIVAGAAGYLIYDYKDWGIKNETQEVVSASLPSERVRIKENETKYTFTSPVFKAKFEFNAIAPSWKEANVGAAERTAFIRTSHDSKNWTEWMEVEVSPPQKDNSPNADRLYPETPIFIEGSYFQFRSALSRESPSEESPEMYDVSVNYIDSRKPGIHKAVDKLGGIFVNRTHASQNIHIVNRQEWASPDPYGNLYRGTDKHWPASYSPTRQVFLHHTVTPNHQPDPGATVRAIWDYHANTLGWGDIGYNYVVDHSGTIYEGRSGGDNVIGGHTLGYNTGSMGVAVLGCFESTSSTCKQLNNNNVTAPTSSTLNSLSTLLSLKTKSYEIDPAITQSFCDSGGGNCKNLWTIAAHKDALGTECNGNMFYDKMTQIRQDTTTKNSQSWAYNAKQINYLSVPVSRNSDTPVTFSFKNTGTATWNNSANPMTLRTAHPRDHTSPFQGSGWPASSIAATMNEASVPPGGTGTFTFNLKYGDNLEGDYTEYFRLTASGIKDFPAYYGVHLIYVNEVPWNFEVLDGDAGSHAGNTADTGLQPATVSFSSAKHVFYYEKTNGDLRQAWKTDGGVWQFAVVDGAGGTNGRITANVGATPAVVAHNNQLHLLYYDADNGNLRYARSDASGTTWTVETLDGDGGANGRYSTHLGQTPALAVYGTSLQAFYYDASLGNLRHAWTDSGGNWRFENLDGDIGAIGRGDANLGHDPSVTTFGGSLQLFYTDKSNGNLRHAWADSRGWHFENLDGDRGAIGRSDADSGHNPVVMDYFGTLQILYYDASNTNLRHAWADSRGWHFENLDGDRGAVARHEGVVGLSTAMAKTSDGVLHAIYYEYLGPLSGGLRYAYADSQGWHFETLDGTGGLPAGRVNGDVGLDPAILPIGSDAHLFYYDRNSGNLRYSYPQ